MQSFTLVPVLGAVMPCGWKGNCRSGQGDEHPAYALLWSVAHLPKVLLPACPC